MKVALWPKISLGLAPPSEQGSCKGFQLFPVLRLKLTAGSLPVCMWLLGIFNYIVCYGSPSYVTLSQINLQEGSCLPIKVGHIEHSMHRPFSVRQEFPSIGVAASTKALTVRLMELISGQGQTVTTSVWSRGRPFLIHG
jgi:hypothetical protein